jgi:hypothetical protein
MLVERNACLSGKRLLHIFKVSHPAAIFKSDLIVCGNQLAIPDVKDKHQTDGIYMDLLHPADYCKNFHEIIFNN